MKELGAKIEAILFACGDSVTLEKLADFLKVSKKELEEELAKLRDFYKEHSSGLQIVFKGNTIQLVSAGRFGKTIASFLDRKINEPLTKAALEVLAIIAYRGPIARSEIEHIRGVNCSFMIRNLAMRGLIEKQENPTSTRSYLYAVSGDFLRSMELEKLEQLPDYKLLNKTEIKQGVRDEADRVVTKEGKHKEQKDQQ